MTVGELKKLLADARDDLDVVVRAWDDSGGDGDDDNSDYCGTIGCAGVEYAHDEDGTPFFAIDCGPEEVDSTGVREAKF